MQGKPNALPSRKKYLDKENGQSPNDNAGVFEKYFNDVQHTANPLINPNVVYVALGGQVILDVSVVPKEFPNPLL